MPLISDYPPVWVPDPPGPDLLVSEQEQDIHAALMLGAFAAVETGVFYAASSVLVPIEFGMSASVTVEGVTYYGVSAGDLTTAEMLVGISELGADGAGGQGAAMLGLALGTALTDGVAAGTIVEAGGTVVGGAGLVGLAPAIIAAAVAALIQMATNSAAAAAMGGFFPSGQNHP